MFFLHHRGTRSSGARAKEAGDSGLVLVTRTWPIAIVQHTRGAWATRLWQRRSSGSEATRVTVPCSWKVEVGIPHLCVKNFQQKKKDRPPARKNLSHVSRSRDLFLFGLTANVSTNNGTDLTEEVEYFFLSAKVCKSPAVKSPASVSILWSFGSCRVVALTCAADIGCLRHYTTLITKHPKSTLCICWSCWRPSNP